MSMADQSAPRDSFRLSMLLYDTRYRSLTIQVVFFILFMAGFAWLINNTIQNLETLGKDFNFGFLSSRAGYDINQRLIEYTNNSTHGRAMVVGLLNTLLVAFLGCILATILGVIAGVLRLSKNWIVGRLMTVYVEAFRNIPVLLWILIIFAIMTESMPPPKDFRGDEATAAMSLWETVAVSNQGIFIPRLVPASYFWVFFVLIIAAIFVIRYLRKRAIIIQEATGVRPGTFWQSIGVVVIPLVAAYFAISAITTKNELTFIVATEQSVENLVAFSEIAGRINYCHAPNSAASLSGLRYLEANELDYSRREFHNTSASIKEFIGGTCNAIVVDSADAAVVADSLSDGLRGNATAVTVADTVMEGRAFEFDVPELTEKGIPRFEGGLHLRNSLIALWLALSVYTGAFIAEIVRAGILAISKGQTEAASALGIRPSRTMRLVILPQALRVIVPPLISQYLNLTKNSSLAIAVGYMDLRSTLGGISLNQTGRELECMLLMMLIYLVISLAISVVMNIYNTRTQLKER